jgi:hypothetical protein
MALSDIVTDVHAQLVIVDAGIATAQPTGKLGAIYLAEFAAPPRVVWVPLRALPDAKAWPRAGSRRDRSASASCPPQRTSGARIPAQPRRCSSTSTTPAGARWAAATQWTSEDWPQQDGGEIAECGTLVVVVFQFRVPITEAGQQSADGRVRDDDVSDAIPRKHGLRLAGAVARTPFMEDVENAAPASRQARRAVDPREAARGWKLAGALHAQKWDPEFDCVTESEFDAAIKAVGEIRIG